MMPNKRPMGKGRTNTSGRNVRSRPQVDKHLSNDGVFANRRFTHATTSLVGCIVQVQVKNKSIYEGIFKTFNTKMDVVLEMVHKVEDNNNSRNLLSSVPSRDRLLDIMIFNTSDILSLTALDVDLDYAVRDNFTDSAIVGKVNGQVNEQEMKELQPWESDGGIELSLDGGETSSNGWDPEDMFRRNRVQFNVQSTYDANLQLYTTPLEKRDNKEFRRREEEAEKLATEIEKSDIYKQRIELENGDGDEEKLYSAVVRPNEPSSHVQGSIGKNQRVRPVGRSRGGVHQGQNRSQHTSRSPTQSVRLPTEEPRINDKQDIKEDKRPETLSPLSNKTSPVPDNRSAVVSPDSKPEPTPSSPTTTVNSKVERKHSAPRARDAQIQELKEFSSNFKLTEEKEKERERERSLEKEQEIEKQSQSNMELQQDKMPEKNEEDEEKSEVAPKVKQSTLNPMAKEFVPNPMAKAKPPQPSQQITTPPRPHTQSPIIQPMQMQNQMFPYHIMQQAVVPMPGAANPTSQQQFRQPKRAVVSVPRDYTAAPAVVQAATGQPLLAGPPHSQYTVQYTVMPQHMVPQVMPMPAVNHQGQRLPNQGNLHMLPTSHQGNIDPTGPPHPTQMYITQAGPGPVPAHMNPHPTQTLSHGHPTPAHMGPPQVAAQQQNQQHNQMAHQSVGHPAPSPVQHTGPQTQILHGQAHPPSSGTPQPQAYNPQIGQQGHPPLQPSPHNPTSPHGIPHHISMPYQLTNHGHVQGANPQFTVQQAHQPTAVSHTMQSQGQNPHIHQQQLVMMPQPQHHHGQVQHAHLQQQPQFQGHPMSGPMPGQSHVIPQTGLQAVLHNSNPNSVHHPSQIHHFVPQVPNQAPQVQAYQQGQ